MACKFVKIVSRIADKVNARYRNYLQIVTMYSVAAILWTIHAK